MPANLENLAVATGLEKVSFHSNPKERWCQRMLKLPHNCKLASTVCEPRTSDIQAGFRKGRGTSDQIVNILWITEKAREFQKKKSTSASLTTLKPLTMWITTNYGKSLKRWEYESISPAIWESCMQVKKKQNWTWNNGLVPNGKMSTLRLYSVTLLIQLICKVCHVKCHAVWSTSWDQDCWEKHQ